MSAPGEPRKEDDAGGLHLIDVPDVAGSLKRHWPFLATRTAVALLVPVFVTMLAKSLDFYGPVGELRLPLEFLAVGPLAYEAKVIGFVILMLVLLAFALGRRAPQFVLGLATGAILWVGYLFTRLQWSKLVMSDFDPLRKGAPPAAAWTWAALLMLAAILFLLVENTLDTRNAQARRKLLEHEMLAVEAVAWRGVALAVSGGLVLTGALVGLSLALRPLAESRAGLARVNPVLLLFALGVVMVLAIVIAARRRTLSGTSEGLFGKAKPPT